MTWSNTAQHNNNPGLWSQDAGVSLLQKSYIFLISGCLGWRARECDVRVVRQVPSEVPGQVPGPAGVSAPQKYLVVCVKIFCRCCSNNCTYCGGDLEDNYPPAALCLAVALFPVGVLGCLALKEKQCVICNRTSSAWPWPVCRHVSHVRLCLTMLCNTSGRGYI